MHFTRVGLWRRMAALMLDWLMSLAIASALVNQNSGWAHFAPLGVFFLEVWILTALQGASAATVEEIREVVAPGTVLLEYYEARGQIYACVLDRDRLDVVPIAPALAGKQVLRLLQFQPTKSARGPPHPGPPDRPPGAPGGGQQGRPASGARGGGARSYRERSRKRTCGRTPRPPRAGGPPRR